MPNNSLQQRRTSKPLALTLASGQQGDGAGRVGDAEELGRFCSVAVSRGKVTSWHVRNRDRRFVESVQEAVEITREVGARLQLSHLSARPGSSPRAWNRCIEIVRKTRAGGER